MAKIGLPEQCRRVCALRLRVLRKRENESTHLVRIDAAFDHDADDAMLKQQTRQNVRATRRLEDILVGPVVAGGKAIGRLVEDLSLYFRDLMRLSLGVSPPRWMQAPTAGRERMQAQAQAIGSRRLGEIIEALGEAAVRLRETAQQSLLLEVTLAHLASAAGGAA